MQIPIGQGLSGWVAQAGRPVLNGNPAVESGYLADPTRFTNLRSAVAVPLVGLSGTIGVLTLYRNDKDSFSSDHLRVLLAITSKVSLAIDNALRFRQAETMVSRTASGLGLGLSIARHLVELHGGMIEASSEGEGRGATFTVTFPLRENITTAVQNAS